MEVSVQKAEQNKKSPSRKFEVSVMKADEQIRSATAGSLKRALGFLSVDPCTRTSAGKKVCLS